MYVRDWKELLLAQNNSDVCGRKGQIKFCEDGTVLCPTVHPLWSSNLVPEWLSDQKSHLMKRCGYRRPEQTKNHCTKTHMAKSLLSLEFMASETTQDPRVIAVHFLSLFSLFLSFSSTNFLLLKSGYFKVG